MGYLLTLFATSDISWICLRNALASLEYSLMQKGPQKAAEGPRLGTNAGQRRYPDSELLTALDVPNLGGTSFGLFCFLQRQRLSSSQPPGQYHDQYERLRGTTVYES